MKKLIVAICILVLLIVSSSFIINKVFISETENEQKYDTVPQDPVEYIKYTYGDNTQIYSCQVNVTLSQEELISELPPAIDTNQIFIGFLFGVTQDNYAVGQKAGIYGYDTKYDGNVSIENFLNGASGAEQVLLNSFKETKLISADEYDDENIIPYDSWQTCASQINLPSENEIPSPQVKG